MARKMRVKTYKQSAVNTVILVIAVFLLIYLAVQFSRNFSTQISTQRTQIVTDTDYAYLDGYVFRDETILTAPQGAIVNYLVRDGEKVGVSQAYAEIYLPSGLSSNEVADKQSELLSLSLRINLMDTGLSLGNSISDLGEINEAISRSYYSYIDAALDGDLAAAEKQGETLLSSLVNYSVATGGEKSQSDSAALKSQRDQLLDSLNSAPQTLVSEQSFNFFYSIDGYESIYSSQKLKDSSAEEIKAMITAKPEAPNDNSIGKKANTQKWYLVVPAPESTYIDFIEGGVYQVSFSDGGDVSINMTLEKICVSDEDQDHAYMLLSSFDLSVSSDFARHQNIKIFLGDCTGYRIPKGALHKVNGTDGVFILVGNTVEFRRVTVIGNGNGYYIVNTYEADAQEGRVNDTPYLYVNDLIITSGNDLYDGKILE